MHPGAAGPNSYSGSHSCSDSSSNSNSDSYPCSNSNSDSYPCSDSNAGFHADTHLNPLTQP